MKKLEIVNDFEKKAILNELSDLNIINLVLQTTPGDSKAHYFFFFHYNRVILSYYVNYFDFHNPTKKPNLSTFIATARNHIEKYIHQLDCGLCDKPFDCPERLTLNPEKIANLVNIQADYFRASEVAKPTIEFKTLSEAIEKSYQLIAKGYDYFETFEELMSIYGMNYAELEQDIINKKHRLEK